MSTIRPRVRKQIERILDTTEKKVEAVIVQVAHRDRRVESLLRRATESAWDDLAAPTSRAFFALDRDPLRPNGGRGTAGTVGRSASRGRRTKAASSKASPGVVAIRRSALATLRDALRDLAPMAAPSRPRAAQRARTGVRGTGAGGAVVPLWASGSVAMRMSVDDLAQLRDSDLPIQGVYLNRVVRKPPTHRSDPRQLPWEVQEAKASSWGLDKIGALSVWGAYGVRGAGSKVAVLDTGVDPRHPDLLDAKGKSRVTDFAQFGDDGHEVPNAKPHDSDQHGTHCAGTVAGRNASGRWIGVAPEASIAAGLVLDGGFGTEASILKGMEWAIDLGVDVISMSLGGFALDPYMPDTYTQSIVNALLVGIPTVIAIGNDGSQTAGSPGSDLFALTVGATDHRDRAAGFSGGRTLVVRASEYVRPEMLPYPYSKPDLSAPGVDVLSSVPGGKWDVFSGTSMATPHVAGAIALLLSATTIREKTPKGPERAQLIQRLLIGSSQELGESGQNHRFGWGRIDVLRAIGFAKDAGY